MGIEIIVGLMIMIAAIVLNGIHSVPEGYVGVYFRGGALIEGVSEPGWHTKLPLVTAYDTI